MHVQTAQTAVNANAVAAAAIAGRFMSAPRAARDPVNPLAAIGSLHKKTSGEALFVEGDDAESIYEVVQGTVRLYKLLPDGRRQIIGFMTAGHLLGLAPEGRYVYSAEAITGVTVRRYRRSAFDRLLDEVPGLARRLLAAASHELTAAQNQMLLLGRKTAAEKVASFILLTASHQGDDVDEVDVPMTRNDIADHLGLTIETVSRTLSKLKAEGLIALPTPTRLEIRDRDRLAGMAAGTCFVDL
jgi:CRP/FNR family transcriptional regulator